MDFLVNWSMKYNEKKNAINRGVKQQYKYKLGSIQTLHHALRGYQSGDVLGMKYGTGLY